MKKNNSFPFLCLFLLSLLSACQKGKYQPMLEEAKASGIQQDSLLLGIQFGMSQDSFFNYCKVLNKEKGLYDSNAKLRVSRKFSWKGENYQMNFYPTYIFDKIHKLEFECFHEAYASWNKQYFAKVILEEMKNHFEKEFQIKMQVFDHETKGRVYVNFTGNRRLRIYVKDQKKVGGEFLDMSDQF